MRLKLVLTLKLTLTPIVDDYKTTTKWLLRALGFTHAIARGGKRYEVFFQTIAITHQVQQHNHSSLIPLNIIK